MNRPFSHIRLSRGGVLPSPSNGNNDLAAKKVLVEALADYWPNHRGNRELASALYQLGFIDGVTYMTHCRRHNLYPLEYETGPNARRFGNKPIPEGYFKPPVNGFSAAQMNDVLARYGEEWVKKVRTSIVDFLPNYSLEKQADGTVSILLQFDVSPKTVGGFPSADQAESWLDNVRFYSEKINTF